MRSKGSLFLKVSGGIAAGATALTWAAYRKDIKAARRRIETGSKVIESERGPIEFAESGSGPAVLVIHGAGGGFDQGLDLARIFLGDGYRIIAPSRFGYLGTPLPADASPEAQADAHLSLLDALKIDRVPVIGVSAGGPSAMQFCLRHREHCSALVLAVPMAWEPNRATGPAPSRLLGVFLDSIAGSDFLFWSVMKVAPSALRKTILGTPGRDCRKASAEERRGVDAMLRGILPVSRRVEGIRNDAAVSSNLARTTLEEIGVPVLVISAANDGYHTYEGGRYTAEHVPNGRFIGFSTGGHLLVGHDAEVRSQIASFLKESLQEKSVAVAS